MASRTVAIGSSSGLHARPAKLFVEAATAAAAEVHIGTAGRRPVPARSLLAVLALGAKHGVEVTLTADGPEADGVLDELAAMLQRDLDAEPSDG
ncbi:MAG: HPr family phosphocarrier protein [Stackebrandtia sp.]